MGKVEDKRDGGIILLEKSKTKEMAELSDRESRRQKRWRNYPIGKVEDKRDGGIIR